MTETVKAHHIAPLPVPDTEYWRSIHGNAWLNCVEQHLANGTTDFQVIDNHCGSLSTMRLRPPQPLSPWGNFNPFDNPYKDSTIQAPSIIF